MTPLLTVCGDFFGGAIEVTDWRLLIAYHVPKHILLDKINTEQLLSVEHCKFEMLQY